MSKSSVGASNGAVGEGGGDAGGRRGSGGDMTDRAERFKFLLQPIRDLAENWDIDIASSLEDYLEELEHMTVSLDGGHTGLNFAEAALLIQGSSAVYGRKVEHLYALVLQTIQHLTSGKYAAAVAGKTGDAAGAGGEEGGDDVEGEEESNVFLLLDDILKPGTDIDLHADRRNRRDNTSDGLNQPAVGLSMSVAERINRPPMFLMGQDHGSAFKMSACDVDKSGALIIEGGRTLGVSSANASKSLTPPLRPLGANDIDVEGWLGVGGAVAGSAASAQQHEEGGGGDGGYRDESDGGDDGGEACDAPDYGGPPEFDDNSGGDIEGHSATAVFSAEETAAAQAGVAVSDMTSLNNNAEEPPDPWLPLDPHDGGKAAAKPFRKGRTYRLPKVLQKIEGSKDRQTGLLGVSLLLSKNESEADNEQQQLYNEAGGGPLTLNVALGGLVYKEFTYILKQQAQRKAQLRRKVRREAHARATGAKGGEDAAARRNGHYINGYNVFGHGHAAEDYLSDDDNDDNDGQGVTDFDMPNFDDTGVGGSDGSDDDDDHDDGFGGRGGGGVDDWLAGGSGSGGGMVFEDGMHAAGGMSGLINRMALEDAFRDAPQTYEDLCRRHIAEYMKGIENYANETRLSLRVSTWQKKLEPLLLEQHSRDPFDIHVYGGIIIDNITRALSTSTKKKVEKVRQAKGANKDLKGLVDDDEVAVPFEKVVVGKERFDVCRLFLASLQLANNGNVVLRHAEDAAKQELTPFEVQLVSMKGLHNIDSYIAPSVAEKGLDGLDAEEAS